jgi:hypothetical protein
MRQLDSALVWLTLAAHETQDRSILIVEIHFLRGAVTEALDKFMNAYSHMRENFSVI